VKKRIGLAPIFDAHFRFGDVGAAMEEIRRAGAPRDLVSSIPKDESMLAAEVGLLL
jgi:hypothetical protein